MRKIIWIYGITVFLGITSTQAQKTISSTVSDAKSGLMLELSTVRLLNSTDSSLVQGTRTDNKGYFELNRIKKGSYVLVVSSIGYKELRQDIKMESKDLVLPKILMDENAHKLQELNVTGTLAQVAVKGDTLEYNANSFKTQENAVVEDLLKKLPGVEIATDGKITVNGQEIKKIRVDGKKFFDGDTEMATKNIPADMVDKIQVLEQKSDMARLTGFEDNDTERIINLTTKATRKQGVFGNVSGGAGADINPEARYDANMNLNVMEGESQTSIIGGANNINNSRSGRGRRGFGGGNSGITTTQNLGVNNNSIINPNFKIGGDASFNHTNNFNENESTKESFLKGLVYNDSSYNKSASDGFEANLRLETELKIDSLRTIILQPNINYNQNYNDSYRDYIYLSSGDTTSTGSTKNKGMSNSTSGGLRVIYNQKFMKPGRTFTLNLNGGFNSSDNQTFNRSRKYSGSNLTSIDQFTNNTSDRLNFDIRASLVEPLWSLKHLLEMAVAFNTNSQNSNKMQYQTNDLTAYDRGDMNAYDQLVSEYSNEFSNRFYSETVEMNYRYQEKTWQGMLGMRGEPSQTYSTTTYGDGTLRNVSNEVFNFSPTANFQYNLDRRKFIRFDYRGRTQQPSISQMQPVKNNSNLMNETVGNPTLNPAYNSDMRLMFSLFDDKSYASFNTMMGANFTKDALVSNNIYDATGKQYSQTVNATGTPVNFFGNIMFSRPIVPKKLFFNTNTNGGYNMRYGYSSKGVGSDLIDVDHLILGDLSKTRSYNVNEQMTLTLSLDALEFGLMGRFRYDNTLNNLKPDPVQTYDWTYRANVLARLPYQFTLSSDINYNNRKGYSNFDQSELLWNASVDKTLFKGKGVVSVKWNDILRQQLNIRQTVGENYVQFNKYNTLRSYFLVTFSYKISQFKGGSKETDFRQDRRFDFGPMPGGRPGERNSPPANLPAGPPPGMF